MLMVMCSFELARRTSRQAFLSGAHQIVYPKFDNGEVVARVFVMDKVQTAFLPKPCEAFKWRVDQVVMLVQVYVPAEREDDAEQVGAHDSGSANPIGQYCDQNDRNAVVVERVRLQIDKCSCSQRIRVVETMMTNRMRLEYRADTVAVPVVAMQNGLKYRHEVIGSYGYDEKYQYAHYGSQLCGG